jgi:hypothetical protein
MGGFKYSGTTTSYNLLYKISLSEVFPHTIERLPTLSP